MYTSRSHSLFTRVLKCQDSLTPSSGYGALGLRRAVCGTLESGKMLPIMRPTARRLLSSIVVISTSATVNTSGAMYNWRVRAVEKALDRVGKAVGPLEVSDLSSLGHLDQ